MRLTPSLLDEAATRGILLPAQGEALWRFLAERGGDRPAFRAAHVLYYLGGLIAIGAVTLFVTVGWEQLGGAGLLAVAVVCAGAALATTEYLLSTKKLVLPAGITATLAVALVPLGVYGLQRMFGAWPDGAAHASTYADYHAYIDWRWLFMELATLAAAAVALRRYRLPFLVLPVAFTFWYLGMDLVPFLLGGDAHAFFSDDGKRISMTVGLAMLAMGTSIDLRTDSERDFGFWLHVFGMLTFWGALTSLDSSSEAGRFLYAVLNLVLIAFGAVVVRRVYAVFGGLGVALYLGHLSHSVFRDSLLFPFALCLLGLAVMGTGIVWQRHEAAIGARLRAMLPPVWRGLVERRAAAR